MTYDLIIRNGTIVDGLGGEPYVGDVAVHDGVITAVGALNGDTARREIDAAGLLVTPGFVDLHTHYDGQSIWSQRLTPSSAHGVTTVVMGNCGVGFAPCRQEDHDVLVDVMAGVEDIPDVVMTDGLPWSWETFPEYLDALDAGKRAGWGTIVSARSGETEDVTVAHLAVGWDAGQLKVGSFARSERVAKWNEVLRIEEQLGGAARFAGRGVLP